VRVPQPGTRTRGVEAACPEMMRALISEQPDGWLLEAPQGWLYAVSVVNPGSLNAGAALVCRYSYQNSPGLRNASTQVFTASRSLGRGIRAENCRVEGRTVSCL
jgi:hypothetical protein